MSKNLILYYSRKGENYVNGSIQNLEKGNSEIVAELIQQTATGDLFEIETVQSYPKDYMACTEIAKKELKEQARPELKKALPELDDYENIFICGPCWWGTYPMAVFSLLEGADFSGKNVFPIMTHEGSGLGSSQRDLKKMLKGARIHKGLAVHGAEAVRSQKAVEQYVQQNQG